MTEAVEALKIPLEQKGDGILVTFRIQPEDLPQGLLLAQINFRFACALVQIDDNEKPAPPPPKAVKEKKKQNANVMRAAIACGEEKFHLFLFKKYPHQWEDAFGEYREKDDNERSEIMGID